MLILISKPLGSDAATILSSAELPRDRLVPSLNIGLRMKPPMAQFSFIPSAEVSDLAEDVREIFRRARVRR